ncbi:MAG: LacI family DNA-binding transcriptional regulator, partial [Microbacterium sp.]|nr:LacI family DNA-binding transcriptional regulator [Microbacterium sp.]
MSADGTRGDRPVGVREVAERAGVSTQTVSRVINARPGIRDETRERVQAAIAELGYRVNNAARSLGTRRSRTLGVIASDATLYGPSVGIAALETAARARGMWMATAYADSTSLFYVSGSPQTYMHGHGTMQELERQQDNAFPRITEQVTKRAWQANSVQVLPSIMHRAFSELLTGRPGPVHVEVPMDVQVEAADVTIHPLGKRLPVGVAYPDPKAVEAALKVLLAA